MKLATIPLSLMAVTMVVLTTFGSDEGVGKSNKTNQQQVFLSKYGVQKKGLIVQKFAAQLTNVKRGGQLEKENSGGRKGNLGKKQEELMELRRYCQEYCTSSKKGSAKKSTAAGLLLTNTLFGTAETRRRKNLRRAKRMPAFCSNCEHQYNSDATECDNCQDYGAIVEDLCLIDISWPPKYICERCVTEAGCEHLDDLYMDEDAPGGCIWVENNGGDAPCNNVDPCNEFDDVSKLTCRRCRSRAGCERLTVLREESNQLNLPQPLCEWKRMDEGLRCRDK